MPRKVVGAAALLLSGLLLAGCGEEYTLTSTLVGPTCVHVQDPWSDRICPDTSGATFFSVGAVESMVLTVRTTDGRTIQQTLPNRTDAIFLTRPALEVFLLRHYDATDKEKAAQLREFIGANFKAAPAATP